MWGAQGGTASDIGAKGGLGAYTSGRIYLNAGETFYIYVGGTTSSNVGGWNGGGNGNNATYGKGGGGATDIRLVETTNKDAWNEFDSLKSRIMVAAGGGGGGGESYSSWGLGHGGAGGGILGMNGSSAGSYSYATWANGATQGAPGTNRSQAGMTGSYALGGNGKNGDGYGFPSGGGGGYYGGGGGYAQADVIGGASGGSSYISGHIGVSSIDESSTDIENILHNGSPLHYSGKYFKNTQMIDGTGYAWTQIRASEKINQPNNAGTGLQTGQSGNGYAKITLQTIEYVSDEEIEYYADNTFNEWHYTYAGATPVLGYYQEFIAPKSGYYQTELWGAQGGGGYGNNGGLGAYTNGQIYLNKGQKLYIYVGSEGTTSQAGWNGGGNASLNALWGSGGGGATDIRLSVPADKTQWNDFNSIKSRIMVAAGGGGGSAESYNSWGYGHGGAGGGLEGLGASVSGSLSYNWGGGGGYQTSPGFATYETSKAYGQYSSFALGGHGFSADGYGGGGGGGGGYYGGGGGRAQGDVGGAGGGGSSYISGHEGCSSIAETSLPTDIVHNGSAYHYSGYYFKNTKMIDGQGYSWTTTRNAQTYQPTWDGKSTQTGQSQGGHARITLVEQVEKTDSEIAKIAQNDEHGWYYPYTYLDNSATSGKYQKFTASKNGYYKIELWAASGITPRDISPSSGLGSYTSGEIYLNKGTTLYVFVGKQPDKFSRNIGGWNGGGNGQNECCSSGGGGATDIRLTPTSSTTYWNGFESLKSRIMVAAGGGGAGGESYNSWGYGYGANGGGIQGFTGTGGGSLTYITPGIGATQTSPGFTYARPTTESALGRFGQGGNSVQGDGYGLLGGGGSGYYGGAGGYGQGDVAGGASSGSSYISGHTGCNSMTSDSTETNMIFTGSSYHYSGYYFINTQMIDGGGYSWNSERDASVGQPLKFGTGTQTGNSGNGYAKITFVKGDTKTSTELKDAQLNNEKEWHYTYSGTTGTSGRYQTFTAPKNGYYSMALWGAQGGQGGWNYTVSNSAGGLGGYTYGEIYLTKGTTLYLYVGNSMTNGAASWNGGGAGGGLYGGAGGGATDIRTVPNTYISVWNDVASLASRIMVAAGGGGGTAEYYNSIGYGTGGIGGGLSGGLTSVSGSLSYNWGGTGGTQTKAGYRSNATTANVGGLGYGGTGDNGDGYGHGGGGGGGYYGGGGGRSQGDVGGAGGGGSSYISGHAGCIATTSDGLPKVQTYTTLADSVSYTNMKFTNTMMIDGAGKKWTTTVGSQIDYQPTYNGVSNKTGNSGVGHARIVYLGA